MNAIAFSPQDGRGAENLADRPIARKPARGSSPPIRLERITHRCLDDGAWCGMKLHKFAARSADQVAALERALGAGNAEELARGARTLKGVAADLSAETLCALSEQLQRTAEQGKLAEAKLALVRTREEMKRCVEAAGQLLGQIMGTGSSGDSS